MTCIVGCTHKGRVYLGGDSAGVGGLTLTVRKDPKVFRVGDFVFGFTSSFRMGQIIQHAFTPPEVSAAELHRYMVTDFVNALRKAFKKGGFGQTDNGEDTGGTFLVGVSGRLFQVDSDYQVGEALDGYDAVGCGADVARGALHVLATASPRARLRRALEAAERCSAGVRGPFAYEVTEK
jgi:hypothetical protein